MDALSASLIAVLILLVIYGFYSIASKIQGDKIVDKVPDNSDDETAPVSWDTDHWESDGSVKVRDLERITGVTFESNIKSDTINALFLQQLNRIPNPGDEIIVNGLCFLALNVKKFRAGTVHIRAVKT